MRFDGPSLPKLGVGLGYRRDLQPLYHQHADRIDWLEIIADHYLSSIPDSQQETLELSRRFRLIPHGLELSVGSHEPPALEYRRQVADLVRLTGAPFYSDHLCITKAAGLEMGQLTPLPYTRATALRCAESARHMQDLLGVPLLLENIAYLFAFPGEMSEIEFIRLVLEESGCGMLLDLANLFNNSQNYGYDPHAFIDALPHERIVQVHLAGSEKHGSLWMDTHSRPVDSHPEVWNLLTHLVQKAPVKAILLERDQRFPEDFGEILADLDKARSILG